MPHEVAERVARAVVASDTRNSSDSYTVLVTLDTDTGYVQLVELIDDRIIRYAGSLARRIRRRSQHDGSGSREAGGKLCSDGKLSAQKAWSGLGSPQACEGRLAIGDAILCGAVGVEVEVLAAPLER